MENLTPYSRKNAKVLIVSFLAVSMLFTAWFAIPFSFSRSQDARMARAFITDEADLCEIIESSVNNNQAFEFNAYGFFTINLESFF